MNITYLIRGLMIILNLLREEPLKAVIDFLSFFKNFLTPHFQREERDVFPVILELTPEKESLIRELIDDHENFRSEVTSFEGSLKELDEAYRMRAEHIIGWHKQHILKEEPLFKLLLEEVLKEPNKT
jgi:hemerythrin-like domain-containing protein